MRRKHVKKGGRLKQHGEVKKMYVLGKCNRLQQGNSLISG